MVFEFLTDKFSDLFGKSSKSKSWTESEISSVIREIRLILLEADVDLEVVRSITKNIKNCLLKSMTEGTAIHVEEVFKNEMIQILGGQKSSLCIDKTIPAVIMVVGLQGSGKTTTCGKLAFMLKNKSKKNVLLASLDADRPAAVEQLNVLGQSIGCVTLPVIKNTSTMKDILSYAQEKCCDVIIVDTAGRKYADNDKMEELRDFKNHLSPSEILLVADAMSGQDASHVANAFNQIVGLTGVIITRVDGDSQGGAALSIKGVSGCPIKFMGTGEKIEDLEDFYPERIVSRIMSMGDIESLMDKTKDIMTTDEIDNMKSKAKVGKFDLDDFALQLKALNKIGGMMSFLNFLPKLGGIDIKDKIAKEGLGDKKLSGFCVAISSMTRDERRNPKIINNSRKNRIAKGAGVSVSDINDLITQFTRMSSIAGAFSKMEDSGMKEADVLKTLQGMSPKRKAKKRKKNRKKN